MESKEWERTIDRKQRDDEKGVGVLSVWLTQQQGALCLRSVWPPLS